MPMQRHILTIQTRKAVEEYKQALAIQEMPLEQLDNESRFAISLPSASPGRQSDVVAVYEGH